MIEGGQGCLIGLQPVYESSCVDPGMDMYEAESKIKFSGYPISIMGCSLQVCDICIGLIKRRYDHRLMFTTHTFSLHGMRTKGVLSISFCTGTVMRKLHSGRWVDSAMLVDAHNIDIIQYSNMMSSALNLIPFISCINPTRAYLNNIYSSQAACRPVCTYDNTVTIVSEYDQSPLFVTGALSGCDPMMLAEIPGLNLLVVFMNRELTFEYGMVMSVSASKRFKYRAYHRVTLSVNGISVPEVWHSVPALSLSQMVVEQG